ncbi:hypothetical protein GYA54_00720 [Candidatus Kuenenbacteria bacterium]|nr:hypothetical protein [Candidatus Kuenenbacteria bacterium]
MTRFILIFLAIIFITLLHLGFLPSILGGNFFYLHLPLLFIVFVSFFAALDLGVFAVSMLGLFLDLYSPLFFGFYSLVFIITILIIKFFIFNFFQHKNFFSLLLSSSIGLIVFHLFSLGYNFLSLGSSAFNPHYLVVFFYQLLFHSLFVVLASLTPNPLGRQLKNQVIS